MIHGKMPHSPCRLESYLQAKKYPAVRRPAKCNFFARKMRGVQPLKHSRYLTSTEKDWWPVTRASERAFIVIFRGNHPNTHRSWGAKLLGRYGTRRGMLNANVILISGLVVSWEYIKNQLWPQISRSDQRIMLESRSCGRFSFTPIEINSVKNRNLWTSSGALHHCILMTHFTKILYRTVYLLIFNELSFVYNDSHAFCFKSQTSQNTRNSFLPKAQLKRSTSHEPNQIQPIRLMWSLAFDPIKFDWFYFSGATEA